MLSLSSMQALCSSRAVLKTSRLSVSKAVTCPAHYPTRKDTWAGSMRLRAPWRGRGLLRCSDHLYSARSSFTSQLHVSCWNCKQIFDETPTFFCMACKAVQPPEEGTSFFKIMDCDYTFTLDSQRLQRRYFQLQRSLHPDNFSQKSVKEQEYSVSQSALVSKAYTTLLKPLSRGLYMLELEGMRIDEGTDPGADSYFLMELMEINEALDEAQTPEEANKIGQDTKGKLADLTAQIDAALRKGELKAAKALLVQMKYYANIEEKVKEKLSKFT